MCTFTQLHAKDIFAGYVDIMSSLIYLQLDDPLTELFACYLKVSDDWSVSESVRWDRRL